MFKIAVIVVYIFLIHSYSFAQDSIVDLPLDSLIRKWEGRDGAMFQEIGPEFCAQLVSNPQHFFKTMKRNPESFFSWVKSLQSSSFTIYYFASKQDSINKGDRLKNLRKNMLSSSTMIDKDSTYKEMTGKLIEALQGMKIRYID